LRDQNDQLEKAKTSAANANTLALTGVVVGTVGIIIAAIALLLNRGGTRKPEAG
jgi:hypothetical protein